VVFPVKHGDVLLGLKRKGFGAGKWNGFGGKVKYGEDVEETAARELWEECLVSVEPRELRKCGELTFIFPMKPEWDQVVHVFIAEKWSGSPTETEEMKPRWFGARELPFKQMWADDPHWLPRVLAGERIRATFTFGSDNASISGMKVGTFYSETT
jgi:8-oxo-dGTP pyrophosphatase MutT (NUDIX family)